MSRERLLNSDQTEVSKSLYNLKNGNYFTDVDSVTATDGVMYDTENSVIAEYSYFNNIPSVVNFIEIKYKPSEHIKAQLRNQKRVDSSTLLIANMCYEINKSRQEDDKANFFYVVQTFGSYPFYVFEITLNQWKIDFNYVQFIEDENAFKQFFN